jgi:hypothetical protein
MTPEAKKTAEVGIRFRIEFIWGLGMIWLLNSGVGVLLCVLTAFMSI